MRFRWRFQNYRFKWYIIGETRCRSCYKLVIHRMKYLSLLGWFDDIFGPIYIIVVRFVLQIRWEVWQVLLFLTMSATYMLFAMRSLSFCFSFSLCTCSIFLIFFSRSFFSFLVPSIHLILIYLSSSFYLLFSLNFIFWLWTSHT